MAFSFDENYFRPEERDGFWVSECMKRYWAASLICLDDFDEICRKYGLRWSAAYGTLLGTVRHKGFIPWDDDIDILMPRDDYDIFLSHADEMPKNYDVANLESKAHKYSGITVINNHTGVSFDEDILKRYCFCPFRAGIDVHVYDYVPYAKNDEDLWRLDILNALKELALLRENEPENIEKRRSLSLRCENISKRFAKEKEASEKLCHLLVYAQWNARVEIQKSWLDNIAELPFETGTIKAFSNCEEVTAFFFGDGWRTPVQNAATHGYPLYKADLNAAISFLNNGGISMNSLPPFLSYLKDEADLRGLSYS